MQGSMTIMRNIETFEPLDVIGVIQLNNTARQAAGSLHRD
jgi:hypothetical protein